MRSLPLESLMTAAYAGESSLALIAVATSAAVALAATVIVDFVGVGFAAVGA